MKKIFIIVRTVIILSPMSSDSVQNVAQNLSNLVLSVTSKSALNGLFAHIVGIKKKKKRKL
jgi:hypothetical protein